MSKGKGSNTYCFNLYSLMEFVELAPHCVNSACRLHDSRTYMESRLLHCYMVILVHFVSLLQVAGSIGGGKVKVAKITDVKKAKLL